MAIEMLRMINRVLLTHLGFLEISTLPILLACDTILIYMQLYFADAARRKLVIWHVHFRPLPPIIGSKTAAYRRRSCLAESNADNLAALTISD